jgi:hypothetical protein
LAGESAMLAYHRSKWSADGDDAVSIPSVSTPEAGRNVRHTTHSIHTGNGKAARPRGR